MTITIHQLKYRHKTQVLLAAGHYDAGNAALCRALVQKGLYVSAELNALTIRNAALRADVLAEIADKRDYPQ